MSYRSPSVAGSRRNSLSAPPPVSSAASETAEHPGSILPETIDEWDHDLQSSRIVRLAGTILSRVNMNYVLQDREASIHDQMIFNIKIPLEGNPVANQLQSGRCWLFATCNVARIFVSRKYDLEKFQLSQSHLFFWDHLSKANWFLEQMMDLADEQLDSRVVAFMLADAPAQDGGQYDMAVALVENYGLVPQSVYPESWNSSNSANLDALLTSKLREMGMTLRHEVRKDLKQASKKRAVNNARPMKEGMMKEIYRILTITCGTPKKPNEEFEWEFVDKSGRYHKIVTTPLNFVRDHVGYSLSDAISVIDDPRHKPETPMTIERLGNVVGGRPLRYLNMPSATLAKLAVSVLKTGTPVWFGCDVDKSSNTAQGIMDMKLFEFNEAFGTVVQMDKKQRLLARDSSMTHAMMFTGVHVEPDTNLPVRWRVENSWGPDACNKGFLVMSHEWFENYVYQVVIPRAFVPPHLLDVYDHDQVLQLPPWDVLGACAGATTV
ncbi:hypothetical protein JCM8547_005743 [Rhodosporidiobolus lusitaniae]